MPVHPDQALFEGKAALPAIAACDHYAGTVQLAEKSLVLQQEFNGSFDITLDLEDGSAVGQESANLDAFLTLICSPANRFKRVGLRVHDFHSPFWKAELEKTAERAAGTISHITIPKTRSPEELALTIEYLQRQCERVGFRGRIPLHVLIETPLALEQIGEIAALPWLRGLDFGLMDFVSSHCGAIPSACMKSPGQFDHALIRRAKVEIVAAAMANDLVAAHNVTVNYNDAEQTRRDAERARNEYGFLRMWSIHPAQIKPIIEAMAPPRDEVQLGCRIISDAYRKDWAPLSIDNVLYDRASYRYFWNLLRRARSNGTALPAELESLFAANGGKRL